MAKTASTADTKVVVNKAKPAAPKPATQVTAKAVTKPAKKPAVKKAAKASKPAKPVKDARPATKAVKPIKPPKVKLVRDSFTMPKPDFDLIDVLKERALSFQRPTKKSELLRAGLHALIDLNKVQLQAVLGKLAPLKTGRPKKDIE